MNKMMLSSLALALFCVPLWGQQPAPDLAAQNAALEQHVRELEDRLIALEGKVRLLQSTQAPPAQPAETQNGAAPVPSSVPQPAPVPTAPSPVEGQAQVAAAGSPLPNYGGASSAAKALNPDVSVIGDFIGAAGGNTPPPLATLQPFPSLQMHESEIGLQAIIDPYARGDFFMSFGKKESIWRRDT